MIDMSKTIAPKSDQLNADDLITGPITVKITDVRGSDAKDQPVSVSFEGDNGKPYKPCLSMRRVMVHCWGKHAAEYIGRLMTLYLDPDVSFGGIKVGGIRISHMSHIAGPQKMALTSAKARRSPYQVQELTPPAPDFDPVTLLNEAREAAMQGEAALRKFWGEIGGAKQKSLSPEMEGPAGLKAIAAETDELKNESE